MISRAEWARDIWDEALYRVFTEPVMTPDYFAKEREFCYEELKKFYEIDSDEWRNEHRAAVLEKRKEFERVYAESKADHS